MRPGCAKPWQMPTNDDENDPFYAGPGGAATARMNRVLIENRCAAHLSDVVRISDAGKSLPLILKLTDHEGYEILQLLKNNDDVRQDKLVQLLFGFINQIALKPERLHLKTYRVVPFSDKCGLIGWLDSTVTIRDCLFKKGMFPTLGPDIALGDHIFPNDMSQMECRKLLEEAQKKGENVVETFREISDRTHARLSFHFISIFPLMPHFLNARSYFVGSTAINSMLGYLLGIGDRHLKNILLCTTTGAIAHIDFGYMFEIGRMLAIPERVPFRLTREIVCLMPQNTSSWVQFQDDCTTILELMRRTSSHVTSAISILLDNVLSYWKQGDVEIDRDKSGPERLILDPLMDPTKNIEARKAIMRVRHKLQGREFSPLSLYFVCPKPPNDTEANRMPQLPPPDGVSCQVQLRILLSLSICDQLLAHMFVGWTPWL